MIETFRKVLDLLDDRERRRLYILLGLTVLAALAELVGLSSVLVFLNALARPDRLLAIPAADWLYQTLGVSSITSFQVLVAGLVFAVYAASLAVRTASAYAVIRYSTMRGYTISSRLLQAYLHQPYMWFLQRNSADISKSVLGEVDQVVGRVILPGIQVIANASVVALILCFLLAMDPLVTLLAGGLIGGSYGVIYLRIRGRLKVLGAELVRTNSERFKLASEATGGFKEVKLMGLETSYVRRFEGPARQRAHVTALAQVLGTLPKFALEGLTFAIMLVLVLVLLMRSGGDLQEMLPTLGVFAFAAMRLMPVLQQIFFGLTALRNGSAVLETVHADYTAIPGLGRDQGRAPAMPALPLTRTLTLETLHYHYEGAARPALNGVSLTIPARTTIGLVGSTGAGKTTLVDMVLGLLTPSAGRILIDGVPLDEDTRRAWQTSIGYVPQTIYLADDTVARNIAFGLPPEAIDMDAVERAARMAALHDFITNELPEGYQTRVGERGVRLSGGQRQRIGIARALYGDPSLLVMDEATSALDTLTETAVMEAIDNVRSEKTVILIAHRLTTVRNCDMIYMLKGGEVEATGRYDELVSGNETFRQMATGT